LLSGDVQALARDECDALAEALRAVGVRVLILQDSPQPRKPDAVFPNNWFSTHADGTLVLYPMQAASRRAERRAADLQHLLARQGFHIRRCIDLTRYENSHQFLEGTGSLVLDRAQRLAYACLSPRTDPDLLLEFGRQLDYEVLSFRAASASGLPIYHTNVLMAVGETLAICCVEAIVDNAQGSVVAARLAGNDRQLLSISRAQMRDFAGNALFLQAAEGPAVALSARAWASLDSEQQTLLSAHHRVVLADIPCIERVGGGSVRCMLAEIFLPMAA
jgi:hypothetical protein